MIGNKKQESGEDKEKRIYCDYGCRGRSWKDSHADTMLQSGDKTKKKKNNQASEFRLSHGRDENLGSKQTK